MHRHPHGHTHFHYHSDYSFWKLLSDFFLTLITGGVWLLWIFIRFLRSNTR